jgi:hypothetical protein
LRLVLDEESPAQRAVCELHDLAYMHGGSRRDRAIADAQLLLGLLSAGMDVDRAEQYHTAVRCCGKPHWADGRGRYSDEVVGAEDPMEDAGHAWSEDT